jgi:23S rRNA (pseudouridine1915-N3)-methyltransferase
LAGRLQGWRAQNRPAVAFVIGGDDGLAPVLREKSTLAIAFGAATWPHHLVRIMLLEQLYRAVTILAGHPYHRS